MCEIVDPNSRGRPLGRWKDRIKEYMCEGESLNKQGGHIWIGRGGDFSALATLLGYVRGGSEVSGLLMDG